MYAKDNDFFNISAFGMKIYPLWYKRGYTFYREFYGKGFKHKKMPDVNLNDRLHNTIAITGGRNGLITRLQANVCELCGSADELEMHHVHKLKNLKGKSDLEVKIIARKHNTLAVCIKCHHKIHAGSID